MAIVEEQAQGIISNRLNAADAHIFLAELQRALAAAVASYLRRGRKNPQVLEGKLEMRSVIEVHLEQP